jgi:Zn-dependent M28 family amino/carboxypeptidase
MAGAPRPARSVLFLWLTGEELGLLGSDWFVAHPLVPLERIAAVVNLDAGAPPAPPVAWNVQGGTRSSLGDHASRVAGLMGWQARLEPASPNSDHFPFLRAGVPAVFLVPAPGPFDGLTTDSSRALRQRWDRYHQPADHWAADFPFGGLVRYATFAMLVARAAAEGPRAVMAP